MIIKRFQGLFDADSPLNFMKYTGWLLKIVVVRRMNLCYNKYKEMKEDRQWLAGCGKVAEIYEYEEYQHFFQTKS